MRSHTGSAFSPLTFAAAIAICNALRAKRFVNVSFAHVALALGDGVDVLQVVAMPGRIVGNPARPEARHLADHRPAVLAQPLLIACGEVVLPLRNSDLGIHMDLALAQRERRVRRLLGAILRVRLPGIHRAGETHVAVARCWAAGKPRSPESHQRLGTLRV